LTLNKKKERKKDTKRKAKNPIKKPTAGTITLKTKGTAQERPKDVLPASTKEGRYQLSQLYPNLSQPLFMHHLMKYSHHFET
jgi:hypothetical protein